jgi:hypothetical protein
VSADSELAELLARVQHLDESFVQEGVSTHFLEFRTESSECVLSGNRAGLIHSAHVALRLAANASFAVGSAMILARFAALLALAATVTISCASVTPIDTGSCLSVTLLDNRVEAGVVYHQDDAPALEVLPLGQGDFIVANVQHVDLSEYAPSETSDYMLPKVWQVQVQLSEHAVAVLSALSASHQGKQVRFSRHGFDSVSPSLSGLQLGSNVSFQLGTEKSAQSIADMLGTECQHGHSR